MSIHVIWSFLMQVGVNVFINCLFWSIVLRLFAPISLTLQGWAAEYGMIHVIWAFTAVSVFAPVVFALIPQTQWIFAAAEGGSPARDMELHRLKRVWTIVCRSAGVNPEDFVLMVSSDMSINACAIGSKYISVNRGTLLKCHDDELAGILAHELGHNQKQHTLYLLIALGMKFSSTVELLIFKTACILIGFLAFIPFLGWVFKLVMYILFVEYLVLHFCMNFPVFYLERWGDRRREFEADAYAVDIGLGECLYRGLYKIAWECANESAPRLTEDFLGAIRFMLESTHPKLEKRMEKIKKRLEKRNTYHNQKMVEPANQETEKQAVITTESKSISDFLLENGLMKPAAAASCACSHSSAVHEHTQATEKQTAKPEKKPDERLGYFEHKGIKFKQICPLCSGDLIRKTDKRGKSYLVCENSKYWHLGNANCDFRRYE